MKMTLNRGTKKKKTKKSPKLSSLWIKAGKAMQDYYRRIGGQCLACTERMSVIHHHFPQSKSRSLRFNPLNFVPLSGGCHFRHHNGDPEVSFKYTKKMQESWGIDWEEKLLLESHKIDKRTDKEWKEYLQTLIHNYNLDL